MIKNPRLRPGVFSCTQPNIFVTGYIYHNTLILKKARYLFYMTTENAVQWSGNHVHSFELTAEDASSMAHQGKCDDDVFAGVRIPYIAAQFDTIAADAIRSELAEYGAWDEVELADDDANRNRFLWCVANDIRERPEDYESKPASTTSGYTNCQACDEPTINALCEWCRLGALENNHDPDQIESDDFNGHLLAVWRASGEAIAEREQNEAYKRETGCDRGSWGAC